jgi:small subunit ribosomal protein S21
MLIVCFSGAGGGVGGATSVDMAHGAVEQSGGPGRLSTRSRDGKVPARLFSSILEPIPERITMIKIKSRGNETAEQMLRRFKKMCEKEGLTKDIKRVAYYEKPSEKRRRRARSKPRVKPMGATSARR